MGKAVSLEQQQALQAQITALINYVPGFKAYGEYYIPGVEFYQYEEIYKDKKINKREYERVIKEVNKQIKKLEEEQKPKKKNQAKKEKKKK